MDHHNDAYKLRPRGFIDYKRGISGMKELKLDNNLISIVLKTLKGSELFSTMDNKMLTDVIKVAEFLQYDEDEPIIKFGEPSDSCFVITSGEVSVYNKSKGTNKMIELGHVLPNSIVGEIGLLLNMPRTADVIALKETIAMKISNTVFKYLMKNIPAFSFSISRFLAERVYNVSSMLTLPVYKKEAEALKTETTKLLPIDFIIRHRVLPLQQDGMVVCIGFVNDPKPHVIEAINRFLPGVDLEIVRISLEFFEKKIQGIVGKAEEVPPFEKPQKTKMRQTKRTEQLLESLLKRMVAEGASDLHISSGQSPRWRIEGEILPISDIREMRESEIINLLEPLMDERKKEEFFARRVVNFAFTFNDIGRFRINIYRDRHGINIAIRVIPNNIMSFEQIGLPGLVEQFCTEESGLILVTGPAGSGKSTTLASMIDFINKSRKLHIVTVENPIEFIHRSNLSLIHQCEIERDSDNFKEALKTVSRKDPNVILVTELCDIQTISLVLENACKGYLVLASMSTLTVVGTIERIINIFPTEEQNRIRNILSDVLIGIISQVLCRKIGGGRIAAFEILGMYPALRELIRSKEEIAHINSIIQSKEIMGNTSMNQELFKLIKMKKISIEEALLRTPCKEDLATLLQNIRG